MSHFQVIGYDDDGEPIYQQTQGDYDVEGYDGVMGGSIMGAVGAAKRKKAKAKRQLALPPRPDWRNQLAPGVIQPDEGLVPLTLSPQAGSPLGTFTSTIPSITFQGQLQKPYRPERLLTSVVRTGTSATGRLLTQLFVGTDLQQAEIAGWDAEVIGQPTAFGTRLTCKAAEPGVFVRCVVTLSNGLGVGDTIFASLTFLGRVIH